MLMPFRFAILMLLLMPAMLIHVGCTSQSGGVAQLDAMRSPDLVAIDAIIEQGIADELYPGAVCIVGRVDEAGQNETLYAQAYGQLVFTHQGTVGASVNLDTLYDMASITKVVGTTTAALLNMQDGELSADDLVATYIDGFDANGKDGVTIRSLMAHTSGLKPYESVTHVEADRHDGERTSDALIRTYAALALAYPTDTDYRYSCLNFQTMARVNENIIGTTQETFLIQRVYRPMGMNDTRWNLSRDQRARLASPYRHDPSEFVSIHDPLARYHTSADHCPGNAGLYSTAPDLARYCQMILNGGTFHSQRIIEAEVLERATKRQTPDAVNELRGLGFDIYEVDGYITPLNREPGHHIIGHTGYTGTMILMDQHTGTYMVLLTNRTYPADENAVDQTPSIGGVRRACWAVVLQSQPVYEQYTDR